MHLHLDLLGGIAGDMFIAAVLDAFPDLAAGTVASIAAAGTQPPVQCRLVPCRDQVLRGARFEVHRADHAPAAADAHGGHAHAHVHAHVHVHADGRGHGDVRAGDGDPSEPHGHAPVHGHTSWRALRGQLAAAPIAPSVRRHALAIFGLLAAAEAEVHGVAVDDVAFHEVGAWDSVADIVGAAHLIAVLEAGPTPLHWSTGAVPLGSGRVQTDHGPMPVPAPATAVLLRGFDVLDDGIAGERVTPTGAAILRHLCPPGAGSAVRPRGRIVGHGTGFGTRRLAGVSNCVRLLAIEPAAAAQAPGADPADGQALQRSAPRVAVVEFEVDDQTPESLAQGLERLRAVDGVIDVVQAPVHGKKGRIGAAVRLLAEPQALAAAVDACFGETTTLGLRHHMVERVVLRRQPASVVVDGQTLRAKIAQRPGGATAKAEADDLAPHAGRRQRERLAQRAADAALASERAPGGGVAAAPEGAR